MNPARSPFRGSRILAGLAVGSTLLLAACGSDGETTQGPESTAGETTQNLKSDSTGATGKQGKQGGDFKPDKKAPASAGDRRKAPDDVISNRPGSKVKPVSP